VPRFCRHNRLTANCPICAREQVGDPRPARAARAATPRPARSRRSPPGAGAGGLTVRRLPRGTDDGYRCSLVPGLRSSADAQRLSEELAFASGRLSSLRDDPPGLYAEVAAPEAGGEREERTWLAFLIAYLSPLERGDPFAGIRSARTSWHSGDLPVLDRVATGPRSAHDQGRGQQTLEAYRTWARRAGSQAAAFTGERDWTPERRFSRAFERLALPGFHRDGRFELLVILGWLGVYELRAGSLELVGSGEVTVAAKRAFGIGDVLLVDRRAAELAQACGLALAALDLGLYNWERGERATVGMAAGACLDEYALARTRTALGLR